MRERLPSVIVSFFFVLLVAGLFYTQILRYGYYSRLSKNNSIRIIPIDGPRGIIFDRNGVALVKNRISFDLCIVYQQLRDRTSLARIFRDMLGMSGKQIADALDKARQRPYAPIPVVEDIEKEKAIMIEEASFDIDGLVMETRSKRDYLYGEAGSHLFGYLSEISEQELEDLDEYGYRSGDLIGREGLEKFYDRYLKGVDGGTQIEVDNRGRQTRVIGLKEPQNGKDLHITIDINLQLACDKLLGESNGAIVVMDPNSGEVLALVSHPAFDPNIFVKPNTSAERLKLLNDKIGRPMSDRAISGLYPPGSVFKIVTASASLETRKITPYTRFFCSGSYRLGRAKFDCWKEGGHDSQSVVLGLMNSCNVFFYNAGRAAGVDSIEAFAKLFGFGKVTGIDLPDEVKGIVPGRAWKRSYRNDRWYEGETINYAIGQGYLVVTPIQVLEMMAVMANKGSLVRPYVAKKIDNTLVSTVSKKDIGISNETIRLVRKGLYEVVNNIEGTGKRAKVDGVVAAGKTGTAQNPHGRTHAWFAGFAPYEDPKICLVVFLENGGKGGLNAAEVARGIFAEAKTRGYL